MELAMAVADLAVSRAGSATVSEFSAVGVPAVYVPYPVGNGEQRYNAADAVAVGGALVVDDADFTPDYVARTVPGLATDPDRLAAMGAAAARLIPRDADDKLAAIVAEVAAGGAR